MKELTVIKDSSTTYLVKKRTPTDFEALKL